MEQLEALPFLTFNCLTEAELVLSSFKVNEGSEVPRESITKQQQSAAAATTPPPLLFLLRFLYPLFNQKLQFCYYCAVMKVRKECRL